jgi:heat-inducible transcriptional repressor
VTHGVLILAPSLLSSRLFASSLASSLASSPFMPKRTSITSPQTTHSTTTGASAAASAAASAQASIDASATVTKSASAPLSELNSRERSILQAIVHNFILHATPVGSRHLSKHLQDILQLSPATIRNAMADLEELGYIAQPHTSAGRVPTDKGYRYYVDSLMDIESLSVPERRDITDKLGAALTQDAEASLSIRRQAALVGPLAGPLGSPLGSPRSALGAVNPLNPLQALHPAFNPQANSQTAQMASRAVSRVLGSLSHYLSIVRLPQVTRALVEKIELYRLVSNRLLVALTLSSEMVRTITLEAQFDLDNMDASALDETQRLLNERIAGKPLNFIRDNLAEALRDSLPERSAGSYDSADCAGNHALLRLFVDSAEHLFASTHAASSATPESTLHIAGVQHLFDYPEFGSADRVRSIIELMESEEIIIHLLENAAPQEGKVSVLIGGEMNSSLMGDYSLLTTKYRHADDASGTIGLIGPKRMNYSRMISIVQHVANVLADGSGSE